MPQLNLAFAFTAGIFATVNPCGWAMLPAFVAYYLGSPEEGYEDQSFNRRLSAGLILGLLVTAGFLLVFGAAGIMISVGLRFIVRFMPLATVVIGVMLALLGIWLLAGRSLPFSLPLPDINLQRKNPRTILLFGMAYAFASLSCTLPIFLAVVGASLTSTGIAGGGTMFLVYGAGMALVLMSVAVSAALLKGGVEQRFRSLLPYVHRIGAGLLIIAGLYLIWYQGRYLPLILAGF